MEDAGESAERAPAAAVLIVILVLLILAGAYYYISLAGAPPPAPERHDAQSARPAEKQQKPAPPISTPQKRAPSGT